MKLLIVTQTVDTEDPVLGFFTQWIEEFSKHEEYIEVICLKEGKYSFPSNVSVHSLGKEHNLPTSRFTYTLRFLRLAWRLHNEYDTVFVHMNQEYVLIAGWLWKLLGKRVYMWRNHYAGSWLTDTAAGFCVKVFCTSKHSYTAKYKKTVLMPVGVSIERFSPDSRVVRRPHSILYLGRISPSKRPEVLINALAKSAKKGTIFNASFYGSPLPQDAVYYEGLKTKLRSLGLGASVSFHPGVPNVQTPDIYRAYEIFVNLSPSGMLDKTIFEAIACGCLALFSSADMAEIVGSEFAYADGNADDLARHLAKALALSETERTACVKEFQAKAIDAHALPVLVERLYEQMKI
jgi:glycosyltransferase involved in cell wall biosynthesis